MRASVHPAQDDIHFRSWRNRTLFVFSFAVYMFLSPQLTHSQTIRWSGRDWGVTRGGMVGVAKGDPANIRIDDKGYRHLSIVQRDGKWTSAECLRWCGLASGPTSGSWKAMFTTWTNPRCLGCFRMDRCITLGSMRKMRSTSSSRSGTTLVTVQCGFHGVSFDRESEEGWDLGSRRD